MASDSKPNLKQLRVDNWAVFFLQRLQLLFAKGDCCDLTLKFKTGQELKVHRLVLSTSTSFFESMESKGNVIHLPENLPYCVVQPIINFLYSGRLEFKAELYTELLAIAKIMKLAILARILIAQKNENGVSDNASPKLADLKKVHSKSTPNKNQTQTAYANILAGKKLPIWKKRTVPYKIERKPMKEEEPRPTRFEWPDEDSCSSMLLASPSFASLSYESAPVISPPTPPAAASSPPSDSLPSTSLKRRVVPPPRDHIPDKIFKPDGNASVILINDKDPEEHPSNTGNASDDDDDDGHFETIHTYGDSDEDIDNTEVESPSGNLKPILKPMTDSPLQTPNKKVRFSFAPEDKENKSEKDSENGKSPEVTKNVDKTDISKKTEKIIQEVFKKYPDLVKNNKNIKLRITAPGSPKPKTITIDAKKKIVQSKSSYIVLKPAAKAETVACVESPEKPVKSSPSDENTKGSWSCGECCDIKFDSYYEYRKHLLEKHSEKGDSRTCEHCGYKATKRNLHLYHLFTKHGVDPPKNVKFPKCSQCSYIALSESLLVKHLNSHQQAKDLTCQVCNTTFKTYSSLHVHCLSCKQNSSVRSYPCPHCKKMFKTNVSLNAHVKECSTIKDEEDGSVDGETEISEDVIEVPVIETIDISKGDQTFVEIPPGIILTESQNVALLPTSESETMDSPIGLTVAIPQEHQQAVIVLDNSQSFLRGDEPIVVFNEHDDEFIVPELLRDEMGQIYTTQNVPYAVTSSGVITCPVMSLEEGTDTEDKDKAVKSSDMSSNRNQSCSGETIKDGNKISGETSIFDNAEAHLQSSNTKVEIKDSRDRNVQGFDDVAQLERALRSPETPDLPEELEMTNETEMESKNTVTPTVNTGLEIADEIEQLHHLEEEENKGKQKEDYNKEETMGEQKDPESNEENTEETSEEPNKNKTSEELNKDKKSKDLREEETNEELNNDKTSKELSEEEPNEELSEEEPNEELNNDKTSKELREEETSEKLREKETSEELKEEETTEDINKEETIEDINKEELNENVTDQPISDLSSETKESAITDKNDGDKATSLVKDWGFDVEEDLDDEGEDPESRPSRPTMDF